MNTVLDEILKKNGVNAESQTPPGGGAGTGENGGTGGDGGEGGGAGAGGSSEEVKDEVDEAKVIAYLKKNKGLELTSLDEVGLRNAAPQPEPTEEEKKAAIEAKKTQVLKFGLESGKIKGESEYKNYLADQNRSARDIAFEMFKKEALEDNAALTEEELEEQFSDENFEHEDENDPKRKRAARQMEAAKSDFLNSKYGHIESLETEYDEFVNETQGLTQHATRVDKVVAQLPKEFSFEIQDPNDATKKITYGYTIPEESLTELKTMYKGKPYFKLFNQGEAKDDAFILATAKSTLIQKSFEKILSEVANSHAKAMMDQFAKGRRGMIPPRESRSEGTIVVGNGISDQIIESQTKQS